MSKYKEVHNVKSFYSIIFIFKDTGQKCTHYMRVGNGEVGNLRQKTLEIPCLVMFKLTLTLNLT